MAAMNKLFATIAIVATILIIGFSTVQLFRGNLGASFSTVPFLLILYLFLQTRRK